MTPSKPDPPPSTRPGRRAVPLATLVGVVIFAVLGSGCGAKPPQAPASEATAINIALSTLANRCGEAREILATGQDTTRLPALDLSAMGTVKPLLGVLRRNAAWIYQGNTVGAIVKTLAADLAGCGLSRTARELARG